jgi:hypothetical protein
MNVGNLELLQDVLRSVALWTGLAAQGGRGVVALLLEPEDVVRLRDRDQLDGPERLEDVPGGAAVGDAETHDDRLGDGKIFRGE